MAEAQTESHRRRGTSPVGSILPDAEAEAPVVDSNPPSVMDMDAGLDLQPSGRPPTNTQTDRDTINSTRSLYDDDIVYDVENGRVYCGGYYMPCDEEETDRLQLQHQVYLRLSNGELTSVPLKNPTKILDVGTGKGDWAMTIADHYPNAEVIGTDIAKIQPTAVPPNCFFEIDDAEDESGWTFAEDDFDLIHFRNMVGAFEDWDRIYAETWTHLKPGGWIEVLDFDEHKGLLSLFTPNSEINNFFRVIKEASEKSGRPRTVKHLEPQRLIAAGFDDIHLTEYEIPFGQWHEDKEKKFLGKLWMTICLAGMEALSLRNVTKEMGWEATEVRRMCDLVEKEVETFAKDKDRVKGAMVKLIVLRAKKPEQDGSEGLVIDDDYDDGNE